MISFTDVLALALAALVLFGLVGRLRARGSEKAARTIPVESERPALGCGSAPTLPPGGEREGRRREERE